MTTTLSESDIDEDFYSDESAAERQARLETDVTLDVLSQKHVDRVVDKLMLVCDELSGHPLYGYQDPFARRVFESLIINDGATLTALFSRQSGKSETVANVVATAMIMFPILAGIFPELMGKFKEGLWVGAFAPVDDQVDTLFGRIVARLSSERAQQILADPEIDDSIGGKRKELVLKRNGSMVRKQTCHPRATIEGRTYHLILVDECFPAGTKVLTSDGWTNIEQIANGSRRDWIVATQEAEGVIGWGYVKTAYRTQRHNDLVRVDHEYGSFHCTANHPIVVDGEKVPAISLRAGTEMSLVSRASESPRATSKEMQTVYGGSLQQQSSNSIEESHGGLHSASENDQNAKDYGAQATYSGGEREEINNSSEVTIGLSGNSLDRRVCNAVWRRAEDRRAANPLQDRFGAQGEEDSGGSGRPIPRHILSPGAGSQEGILVEKSRVVGVTVLQQGSPEFDQFSDSADYVYTLEVDSKSHTYVAAGILVGNCQGAEEKVINKSIAPMGTATNATMVFTGTPTYQKGAFYKQIQQNKRNATKRNARANHFEADWKTAAKWNKNYGLFVKKELLRIGEDSDEFKLSYRLIWLLDRGMFSTSDRLDELGDLSMEVVRSHHSSPIVIGIDPARKQDSTILTAVWVGWEQPDEFGYYEHRILNWLDLQGMPWEEQYFRILEFCANYNVFAIGVDSGGVGDVVASRLRVLMPHLEIIDLGSQRPDQSTRWKHLMELMDRGKLGWPAHAKTRRLKTYRRFRQQMEDLEKKFEGPYVLAEAPREAGAADDYADSLALACVLTRDYTMPTVEVSSNPFFGRRR